MRTYSYWVPTILEKSTKFLDKMQNLSSKFKQNSFQLIQLSLK